MYKIFFITSFSRGGAETYLLRYLRYCNDKNVIIVSKSGAGGCLESEFMQYAEINKNIKINVNNILGYFKLYKFFKSVKISVICDFTGNFSGLVMFVAWVAGIGKRIVFFRESKNQFKPSFFKNLVASFYSLMAKVFSTRILSNTQAALDNFYPSNSNNPNKFNNISFKSKKQVRELMNIEQDTFLIGHVGRFAPAKNHDLIIACALQLCSKYPDIRFVLVGRDVYDHYYADISSRGLSDRILLFNEREDVFDILKALDLFFFPSISEGQPNALIEAMVSGLPFIASDIPSIKETVPKRLYLNLYNPYSIDDNLNALERAYANRYHLDNFTCAEWAKDRYNADLLFREFSNELN